MPGGCYGDALPEASGGEGPPFLAFNSCADKRTDVWRLPRPRFPRERKEEGNICSVTPSRREGGGLRVGRVFITETQNDRS